jgi:hypothetical protein
MFILTNLTDEFYRLWLSASTSVLSRLQTDDRKLVKNEPNVKTEWKQKETRVETIYNSAEQSFLRS